MRPHDENDPPYLEYYQPRRKRTPAETARGLIILAIIAAGVWGVGLLIQAFVFGWGPS